ncbi:MAG: hypothetical protein LBQ03_01610 [Puniceicoccales bacterium]|jgi:serine/threonine protein kinase|nr:hypothetical protein [Puniceicoccales bacterium]
MKKFLYSIVSFLSFGMPFSAFSAVDVAKYRMANPDPLEDIPEDIVIESGNRLGGGTYGDIYSLTIPNFGNRQRFVQKLGSIEQEAVIGELIRDTRNKITPQTQIADIQGLALTVPGKKLNDGSLLQERVEGVTLANFVDSFRNGWIDSPKKALERLCGLLSSLYALEKAGIVHGDLHALNIMVERKKLPDAVIVAMETQKERTEENLYEYIYKIIDFGGSININDDEEIKDTSSNMQLLGTLMPLLLFGNHGAIFLKMGHYVDLSRLNYRLEKEAKAELIQERKNSGQKQDELALEIMSLEKNLDGLNETSPKRRWNEEESAFKNRVIQHQEQINTLQRQLEAKSKIYEETYGENIKKYEESFEVDLRTRIDAKKNQHVMEGFRNANAAMQEAIDKSYPESILMELAQITADCLSSDCTKIPTAAEVYKKVTHFAFSNWQQDANGDYKPEVC